MDVFDGLNIEQTLIVDNRSANFVNSLDNGVPILPFDGSEDDQELLKLTTYLERIAKNGKGTLQEKNSNHFKLDRLKEAKTVKQAYESIFLP